MFLFNFPTTLMPRWSAVEIQTGFYILVLCGTTYHLSAFVRGDNMLIEPLLTSLFHLRYGTMPVNSCHNYLYPYLSKYYPGRTQFDHPTTFFVLSLNLVSWNVRGGILLAECGGAEFIPALCLQTQDTVSALQFACKIHQEPLSEIKITVPQAVHWYDSI